MAATNDRVHCISLFTKQADGRLEKTPLYNIVRDELDSDKDFDLISAVYDELEQKRDEIAKRAILLDKVALYACKIQQGNIKNRGEVVSRLKNEEKKVFR